LTGAIQEDPLAREIASPVASDAVAKKLLQTQGIAITEFLQQISCLKANVPDPLPAINADRPFCPDLTLVPK